MMFLLLALAQDLSAVAPRDVAWAEAPGMPAGARSATQYGDPTKERYAVLLKFPAGASVAPHTHKADEIATIVSGVVVMGQGETADPAKGVEVGPGGVIIIPAGTPHWAMMKEDLVMARYGDGPREMTMVKAGDPALPKTAGLKIIKAAEIPWAAADDLGKGAMKAVIYGDPAKERHILRLKFPAGTLRPAHWHSADECVTVLSGTLAMGQGKKADEKAEKTVEAGGYFIVPAKQGHWVRSPKDVVFQIFVSGARDITYFESNP